MIKYRDVQATKETAYDIEVYQSKWTTGIKGLLDRCGMSFLWDQYCNVNKKWTKKSIEVRLDDPMLRSATAKGSIIECAQITVIKDQ